MCNYTVPHVATLVCQQNVTEHHIFFVSFHGTGFDHGMDNIILDMLLFIQHNIQTYWLSIGFVGGLHHY